MSIVEELKRRLGEKVKEAELDEKQNLIKLFVESSELKDVAKNLNEVGFDNVVSVTALDFMTEKKLRVIYHISSYLKDDLKCYTLQLSCDTARERPKVPSLSGIWTSALFHERETYEMFGVIFEGHPDLRPVLLPEELMGKWPMRKDFRG